MTTLSAKEAISLYRGLLLVRQSEETLAELYKEQEMRTPTHFGVGQEAVAVGVCRALRDGDVAYSHHRCHNHFLAKGGSVASLAAELYGRETGCARGRGGSVHLTAVDQGFVASSAILGQTLAVAVGSALAFSLDRQPRVAVTFFGDAALEEGVAYESFNFAALRKLPVLFVCENNLYSTESPLSVRQPVGTSLCERLRSFRVSAHEVDGNDVAAVYAATQQALETIRAGEGPVFLECFTYRWREHVGPNFDHELDRTYRSREELEQWMTRCPVKRAAQLLLDEGWATPDDLARFAEEVDREVAQAVMQARKAPWPDTKDLLENVY